MCFYPLLQFFDPLLYLILNGRVKPLQLLTHDIETLCQLLNLVPGMDVYAMVKVSTCNDFCAVLEFLYGRTSPLVIHFFHKACSICVADGVRNCKYPERYLPYILLCSPGIWQEYYCECDEELGADFECHKTLSYKGKFGGISSEFKIQPFKIDCSTAQNLYPQTIRRSNHTTLDSSIQ